MTHLTDLSDGARLEYQRRLSLEALTLSERLAAWSMFRELLGASSSNCEYQFELIADAEGERGLAT